MLKVSKNVLFGIIRLVVFIFLAIVMTFVRIFTYEPGKKYVLTPKKFRRIRFFTKLKIFANDKLRFLTNFFGVDDKIEEMERRIGYGV